MHIEKLLGQKLSHFANFFMHHSGKLWLKLGKSHVDTGKFFGKKQSFET
jgi:hypothetical protein